MLAAATEPSELREMMSSAFATGSNTPEAASADNWSSAKVNTSGALLISAILTAIYMLTIVMRAFFPKQDFDYDTIADVEDPNWMMLLPLALFCVGMIVIGLHPQPLLSLFESIANGLF